MKYITCPQCGKRLCRAELGSNIELSCPTCKANIQVSVDKNGGVHTLPLVENIFVNRKIEQA